MSYNAVVLSLPTCAGARDGLVAPSLSRHLLQECTGGNQACAGTCVDVMTDANNCGGCGQVATLPNANAICSGGQAAIGSCWPG
jgi:hypothetical protein